MLYSFPIYIENIFSLYLKKVYHLFTNNSIEDRLNISFERSLVNDLIFKFIYL